MKRIINLLIIAESESRLAEIRRMPGDLSPIDIDIAGAVGVGNAVAWLKDHACDVILLDATAAGGGLKTLDTLLSLRHDLPVVAVLDSADDAVAVNAFRLGARDCLLSGETDGESFRETIHRVMERERIRWDIQAGDSQLKVIVSNLPDGIVVVDHAGIIRYINSVAETIFGRPHDELFGKAFGYPFSLSEDTHLDIYRPDGVRMVVEMRSVETEWMNEPAHVVMLRDITQRKLAEEAWTADKVELETIFDNAPIPMLLVDHHNRIRKFNRRFNELTDKPEDEIIGARFGDVIECLNTDNPKGCGFGASCGDCRLFRSVEYAIDSGRAYSRLAFPVVLKRKSGRIEKTMVVSIAPVMLNEIRMAIICIERDTVTDSGKTEPADDEPIPKQPASRLFSDIVLADVSRGNRNLMGSIIGLCDIAAFKLSEKLSANYELARIREIAGQSLTLVDTLRPDGGKPFHLSKPVNLGDVIAHTQKKVLPIPGRTMKVVTQLDDNVSEIKAVPELIEHMFAMLFSLTHRVLTNDSGLTLSARNIHVNGAKALDAPELLPGEYVKLSLGETRPAETGNVRSKIFEPFYSIGMDHAASVELASLHELITHAGGVIAMAKGAPEGRIVDIYFPVSDAGPNAVHEPIVDPQSQSADYSADKSGSETILVVEESAAMRLFIRETLDIVGYTVLEAGDGSEAMLISRKYTGNINLVLTDVIMPHLDGPPLMERIRQIKPAIRTIYMSAYTDDEILRRGIRLPEGTPMIHKPFSINDILSLVRKVLDDAI